MTRVHFSSSIASFRCELSLARTTCGRVTWNGQSPRHDHAVTALRALLADKDRRCEVARRGQHRVLQELALNESEASCDGR